MSDHQKANKGQPAESVSDDDRSRSPARQSPEPSSSTATKSSRPTTEPINIRTGGSSHAGGSRAKSPVRSITFAPAGVLNNLGESPIPIDNIIKTANDMSSMRIAHKIALDDDFRLEPGMDIAGPLLSLSPIIGSASPTQTNSASNSHSQKSSEPTLHNKVKEFVHQAYWDLFKEELDSQKSDNQDERKFEISKQLLRDIKQKIFDLLLPQHRRLRQDLDDRLDVQIIDQLCRVGSLDLYDYANYILDVLSKMCAPVRDEKLSELKNLTDLVQLYRGIMELLDLMQLDFANFTLNSFKPHIKAHSQEYEREKFNAILEQQRTIGIDGLEFTKIWLERAVKRIDEVHGLSDLLSAATTQEAEGLGATLVASKSSEDNRSIDKTTLILRSDIVGKVLNVAYCELLEWSPEKQKLYPETLLFDEATFTQLSEQYRVLLTASSILLTTFAFVSRFKIHENSEFRATLKSHVITLLTASYDRNDSATSSNSPPTGASDDGLDRVKLETIATRLSEDIRQKIETTDRSLISLFENQREILKNQILDLQNSSCRIKDLARRRILEFVDTLLTLDVMHEQRKFSSKHAPPVNIPLGLNCLTDELTLTMAQLVKIVRYNRRVFFQHYQDIIVEHVLKVL